MLIDVTAQTVFHDFAGYTLLKNKVSKGKTKERIKKEREELSSLSDIEKRKLIVTLLLPPQQERPRLQEPLPSCCGCDVCASSPLPS